MRLRTSLLLHVGPFAVLAIMAVLVTLPLTTWLEVDLTWPGDLTPAIPTPTREARPPLEEPRLRALLGLHPPVPAAPVVVSRVPFAGRLLGTLTSTAHERSMASLALTSGEVRTVWEGDRLADAEIISIERGAVVLSRNGSHERLELHPIPAIATPRPVVAAVSVNDYRVSRAEVLRRMSDLYALSREVRVVPAFRDGQPIGFRFAGITPDSPAAQLGLQSGDVIRSVNGKPMDSVERVLALAASLSSVGEVQLELERAGQPLTHRYRLD